MKSISPKQQAMLSFIEEFMSTRGYPPTYEEIRTGMGLSTKSLVDYHLNALEAAGCLRRDRSTPRGLRRASKGFLSASRPAPRLPLR